MGQRSVSDVPNRVVRIFLERAGEQYDQARKLAPYRKIDKQLIARFNGLCAYCNKANWAVEEHIVPINREAVGLHAWGNVVPACRPCNERKKGGSWREFLRELHAKSQDRDEAALRIQTFIDDYGYSPDTTELRNVAQKLYELVDTQTRALLEFAVAAAKPATASLGLVRPATTG